MAITISDFKPRYLRAIAVFFVAALLQATVGPAFQIFGAHADLLLALTASWALIRSAEEAMAAAPPAAVLLGMLGAGPIGTPLLTLVAPIALALALRDDATRPRLVLVVLATIASSLAAVGVEVVVDFLSGQRNTYLVGIGTLLTGETILNCLAAAAFFALLRLGPRRQPVRRAHLSLS